LLKKKKFYKTSLKKLFSNTEYMLLTTSMFRLKKSNFFLQNIFRISMSFKQLFFSLINTSTEYTKLFSTGVILKSQIKHFKFFKKSILNINPLVMTIRYAFAFFFKKLYLIECLNYSKRQYIFLKKFVNSIKTQLKYMLFKKTWEYTTKPVKRIKRRVTKLLKNL